MHALSTALVLEPFPLHAPCMRSARRPPQHARAQHGAPPPRAHRCDALDLERSAAQEQAEATAEQLEDLKRRLAALQLDAQAARSEAAQQASVLGKQQQQLEALAAQARLPETIDKPLMTASEWHLIASLIM
jgi:hypothetical protein